MNAVYLFCAFTIGTAVGAIALGLWNIAREDNEREAGFRDHSDFEE